LDNVCELWDFSNEMASTLRCCPPWHEDETAIYDATLFPDAFRRYGYLLVSEGMYVLKGLVEESFGTVTVTIHHVERLGAESRRSDSVQ
jgi:hypothetical protein